MVSLVFLDILQLKNWPTLKYNAKRPKHYSSKRFNSEVRWNILSIWAWLIYALRYFSMSTFHLEVIFLYIFFFWPTMDLHQTLSQTSQQPTCHPCCVCRYPSVCSNNSWKDSRRSHRTPCQSRRWGRGWTPRRLSGGRSWGRGRQTFFCPGGP